MQISVLTYSVWCYATSERGPLREHGPDRAVGSAAPLFMEAVLLFMPAVLLFMPAVLLFMAAVLRFTGGHCGCVRMCIRSAANHRGANAAISSSIAAIVAESDAIYGGVSGVRAPFLEAALTFLGAKTRP